MRYLHIVVIFLVLFSYPIVTVWLTLAGFETSTYNLATKVGIVGLSLLGLALYRPTEMSALKSMSWLLLFFALFGMRLIYDIGVLGIDDPYQTPLYVFGYFFGLTLLPAMLLAVRLLPADLPALDRAMVIGLVLANISLLVFSATRDLTAETAFAGRVQQAGEVAGTAVLGPIMVGTMGSMLAAYSVGRIALDRHLPLASQLFFAGMIALGGLNILFSGSRGPAVAFAIAFMIVVITLIASPFRKVEDRARSVGWLYAGLAVIGLVYLLAFTNQEIFLFDRFEAMYGGAVSAAAEERNYIYAVAWQDFLSSPIVGKSFIVSVGGYSAHNFVLEALMATGVVGGMLFTVGVALALLGTGRLLLGAAGPRGYAIALVSICMLVVGGTSGSVRETPELWALAAIMTIFGAQAARSEKQQRQSQQLQYV